MIRINLIGRKVKQKKSQGSYQLLIYLGMIGAAVVVLFLWHQSVVDELEGAKKKAREAAEKVENLMRVKQQWEAWQVEKGDLDRQIAVFNALQADQIGPSMALQYLSYALTRVGDDPMSAEEVRVQELAGWNPKWDPARVWLKSMEIKDGKVEIRGEAIDHEDVAEFYRRLESSGIFKSIAPGLQRRRVDDQLQVKFVEFSVGAMISFVETALAWREAQELAAIQAAQNAPQTAEAAPEAAPGGDKPAGTGDNPGNEGTTNE